jgi:hypothetical protein
MGDFDPTTFEVLAVDEFRRKRWHRASATSDSSPISRFSRWRATREGTRRMMTEPALEAVTLAV